MHVPVLMMLDKHFEQNAAADESAVKEKKRKLMLFISFALCLFFGTIPFFTWTPMNFEPSKLSCSVYSENPDLGYISYIMTCFFFFEFLPLTIVTYCKVKAKKDEATNNKVRFFKFFFSEWLYFKIKLTVPAVILLR